MPGFLRFQIDENDACAVARLKAIAAPGRKVHAEEIKGLRTSKPCPQREYSPVMLSSSLRCGPVTFC